MEEIYQKKHIYAEGWTNHELEIYSKRAKLAALLSIVVSLILLVTPLILIKDYSQTVTVMIVTYAVMSILLAGLVVVWTQTFEQETYSNDTLGTVETSMTWYITSSLVHYNKNYSTFVLVSAFFMILLSGFLGILVAFWKDVGDDYYVAAFGATEHYLDAYQSLMEIVIPFIIVNCLLQGVIAFASYITMDQKEYLRILIYLFTCLFAFNAFLTLHFVKTIKQTSDGPTVPVQFGTNLTNFCLYECLFAIFVLSVATLITNFLKRTNYYFIMGSLVLVSVFCFALTQYLFFKTTIQMRDTYNTECPKQMRLTHLEWLKTNTQCDKYVTLVDDKKTLSQQCSQSELAQTWDLKNTNQLACLNTDCCQAMAYSYSEVYFYAAFSLLSTVVFGFALTICLFQISTKAHDFPQFNKSKDYLCITLFIVVVVLGSFLYISADRIHLPQRAPIIAAYQSDVIVVQANKDPIVYPKNWNGVTGCKPLSKVYGKEFEFKACTPSTQTCGEKDKAVRVSLLTEGAAILVTDYTNSPNLMYIQQQLGQKLLFPQSTDEDGFLSVQGHFEDVAYFLNSNVEVCQKLATQENPKPMQVDIYYLPMPHVGDQTPPPPTRMLASKHKTGQPEANEEGEFKLTKEQEKYLDDLTYVDLQMNIMGQDGAIKAEVMFFRGSSDCGGSAIPSRFMETDSKGSLLIYNLVVKQFFFSVRAEGHYLYCNSFTLHAHAKPEFKLYQFDVSLVAKDTKKGQVSVVLQQQIIPQPVGQKAPPPPKYTMSLAATFKTIEPKATCQVGFVFDYACGGMLFIDQELSSQVITVAQLVKTVYTFYVQFLPTDPELQSLNRDKAEGLDLTPKEIAKIDNTYIWSEMSPVLTLYASEQDGPIVQYQLSKLDLRAEQHAPNLTWLALCLDGNVGDVTQASPNKFWNYAEHPKFYERSEHSQALFPESSICESFYAQK